MRNVGIAVLVGSLALAGLCLLAWLAGLVLGTTLGGLVHLLLVFAILVGPAGAIVGIFLIIIGGSRTPPR